MINITPALEAAFAPHTRNYEDVVIRKVPSPVNALKILIDMGLSISKKIVVNVFNSPYYIHTWEGMEKEKFICSYAYLEEGTEDDNIQNNVATYNPSMETLTIHIPSGSKTIGRKHGKCYAKKWMDVSDCFAA